MSKPVRILITAGSTREPIDPVRFIGNRSSGKLGAALVAAAIEAGHIVTLIAGPMTAEILEVNRIDIETAVEMHATVLREFPNHDVIIMAAAVADFRPIAVSDEKLSRSGALTIECEPTADIVAEACRSKNAKQFVVAFSLESDGNLARAREKMVRKGVDLMVYNALSTMGNDCICATLLTPGPDGDQAIAEMSKDAFARLLIARVAP